jgi:ketosteroid isomerase-like protein
MSREDVTVVREWVSTYAGRDQVAMAAAPEEIARFAGALHPEIEGRWAEAVPGVETHRGLEDVALMFLGWLASWDEYRQEPVEFIDAGDAVVVPYRCRGIGKDSGVHVEMDVTHVYTVREGKIASLREYMTKAEALEAVGLSE